MQPQWSELAKLVNEEKREVYIASKHGEKRLVLGVSGNVNRLFILSLKCPHNHH